MKNFNKTALRLAVALTVLLLAACSKGELRSLEKNAHHCAMESSEKRADFILQCIKNANPKSDEEPEDWIQKCQRMAEETLCPEVTMVITERCASDMGCFWIEVNRKPKGL